MKKSSNLALLFLALFLTAASSEEETKETVDSATTATVSLDESSPSAGESKESEQAMDLAEEFDELFDEFEEYEEEKKSIADPLKYWNVAWFHFNDNLYFWALKPVSKGYGFVVPKFARKGVHNFFYNVKFPVRFVSNGFQARPLRAGTELGRFLVNTTVGVAGLFDPATHLFHWKKYDEDFDQTLGVWRIGQGIYLTWPLVGPSSIRGTFGFAVDTALNPVTWLGGGLLDQINYISLDLYEYESLVDMAIDPYSSVRDAYVQNRKKKISE